MDTVTDRHGLEVLDLAECLALLKSRPMGRLAYVDAGTPVVVPVNHLVDGTTVVFRTTLAGGKLDAATTGQPVAFQLDDHDPARGSGWSVLVQGWLHVVDDAEAVERYEARLDTWASGDLRYAEWLRVVPDHVSGRRLRRYG
jgi:uncharacterized protein